MFDMSANMLLKTYDKILKVNLTQDSYSIIKYDIEAEKELVSSSKHISEWFLTFVLSGNVYFEDLETYKKYTSLSYLQEFFKANNNHWVQYRRKYGDKFCWCEMLMLKAEDYTDDNQEIYLFVKKINEVSNEELNSSAFIKSKRVLILDDNDQDREDLTSILKDTCDLLVASNKEEAYEFLRDNYRDTLVIIGHLGTDETLFEHINAFRKNTRYANIPIIIATNNYSNEHMVKCLESGAFDVIVKPYSAKLIVNKINNLAKLRYSVSMINAMKTDPLTGLYTKQYFFNKVEEILELNPDKSYRMVCTDVENFRLINENHGTELGDRVLVYIAEHISDIMPNIVFGGRISGDIFAFLREDIPFEYNKDTWKSFRKNAPAPNVVIKYGLSTVDRSLSVQTMCDHAMDAAKSVKHMYGQPFAEYDSELQEKKQREKIIVDYMDDGLAKHQFEIYYQPKLDIKKNKICGAEALIRWIHPEFGFLSPAEFIPIFEKNGFIKELDMYVLDQACYDIRSWIDGGFKAVPISINLSRMDFENPNLLDTILATTKRYDIDPSLIHFEVTESAFANNLTRISSIISSLSEKGYIIELDDFGAGYSSLTMLDKVKFDVIKIDKSILSEESNKDNKILQFCLQLADILDLKTIVEGVELKSQLEELKQMGCDAIQGYYYSKPVPKVNFTKFLML